MSRRQFQNRLFKDRTESKRSRQNLRMTRRALLVPLLLGLFVLGAVAQEAGDPETPTPPPPGDASSGAQVSGDEEDQEWGVNSLRGGFEAVSGYFDSMLEFMGGRDGVCQYRCRFGESRVPPVLQQLY